jgi:hypothetical protein
MGTEDRYDRAMVRQGSGGNRTVDALSDVCHVLVIFELIESWFGEMEEKRCATGHRRW